MALTTSDLINVLSEEEQRLLSSDDPSSTVPDSGILQSALDRATTFVLSKVRVIDPEATDIPPELEDVTLTIAKYNLFQRRNILNDAVVYDFEVALRVLNDVVRGTFNISRTPTAENAFTTRFGTVSTTDLTSDKINLI